MMLPALYVICILSAGKQNGHQSDIQALHPSHWDVHLFKSNIARARGQSDNKQEQLNSISNWGMHLHSNATN